jgi:hypothetical protein
MLVHVDAIGLEHVAVTTRHLNQIELSRRWGFSPRTLEGWRWFGKGRLSLKRAARCSTSLRTSRRSKRSS